MWNITTSEVFPKTAPKWDGTVTVWWGGPEIWEYSGNASVIDLGEIIIPNREA